MKTSRKSSDAVPQPSAHGCEHIIRNGRPSMDAVLVLATRAARYQRDEIFNYALDGDWAPLAEYIRRGGRITPYMRPFLVEVLNGQRQQPPVKISRWATKQRNGEVVNFIGRARDRGEKEAEYSIAAEEKFGRTWRHLQKILAQEKLRSDKDKILQGEWHDALLYGMTPSFGEGKVAPGTDLVTWH